MDPINNSRMEIETQEVGSSPRTQGLTSINRREWLRMAVGGGAGLALGDLLDLSTVRASAQKLKLANVSEFTTSCNFCSCGCGMIAAVREGKLIDTRLTEPTSNAALPSAGQRPLGGHLLGRRVRAGRSEDSEDARRDLDRHREGRRQGGSGQSGGRDRLPGRRAEHERGVLPFPEGGPAARPGLRPQFI